MYIYVCIYMHTHTHTDIHAYTHTHTRTHTNLDTRRTQFLARFRSLYMPGCASWCSRHFHRGGSPVTLAPRVSRNALNSLTLVCLYADDAAVVLLRPDPVRLMACRRLAWRTSELYMCMDVCVYLRVLMMLLLSYFAADGMPKIGLAHFRTVHVCVCVYFTYIHTYIHTYDLGLAHFGICMCMCVCIYAC